MGVITGLITTMVIAFLVKFGIIFASFLGYIMVLCVLAIPVYYCYDAIKVRRRRNENRKRRK